MDTNVPLCHCDSMCEIVGDCCDNYKKVKACQKSSQELGSGLSETPMSFEHSGASGAFDEADVMETELTASPEVVPSHVQSGSAPVKPSMANGDSNEDGGGQSSSPIVDNDNSYNFDYSSDFMLSAGLDFAMMQSCEATSYKHYYEHTNITMYIGAYMVSLCPTSTEDSLLDFRERCESFYNVLDFGASFTDISNDFADYLPVTDKTDPTVHYKNMYCAFCNGVQIHNAIPWNLRYLNISESSGISFWVEPLYQNMTRRCFANSFARGPAYLKGIPIAEECDVWVKGGSGCTSCLTKYLDEGACRKLPQQVNEEPLAIPFDFRSYASKAAFRSTHQIICSEGFYFSKKRKQCLPKQDVVHVSPPCGQSELVISSYLIKMSFTTEDPSQMSNELVRTFLKHMMYSRDQIRNQTVVDNADVNENTQGMNQRCKRGAITAADCDLEVTATLQFEVFTSIPEGFNVTHTRHMLDQLPYALLNVSTELHWIEYLQPCGSFPPLGCQGEVFDSNVVSFMKVNNTLLTDSTGMGQKMYATDRIMSKVTYRMQDDDDDAGPSNIHQEFLVQDQVILCNGEELLKCPSVLVDNQNYIVNEVNDNLRLMSTGEIVPPDRYIILENTTALVCVDMGAGVWEELNRAMKYIYLIGTSISLFALLLTFLTYCALAALRTVPGIATMNFIVASFVAQFGLLIGGKRIKDSPIQLCTFFAILLHYVWLASFFWTTALAFDVSRTLGTGMQPGGGGKGKKLFLYSTFSWGGPLLIILPSLVFHFCDCTRGACCSSVSFMYGTEDVCWIRPQTSNVIAFGVPVMASLVFNIALFSRTVSGVRSSKRATSMIERRRVSVVQRAMNEFTIYIKVSMLMGFSWIWGFLFGFTGITALWTIFVIFNSVQGIFIFWAFACTSRVWGMLKQRFRSPSSSRHTPSPNDYLGTTESQTRTKRISVFSVNNLNMNAANLKTS